jgi:putative redox protein
MTIVRCATITASSYPVAVHLRDHTFNSDVSTASGGTDSAPGPHDYFDAALATCKAETSMWYAKRHAIPLERVECVVESDDSQERAGVYAFRVRLTFEGPLTDEHRVQLHRAAAACPITKLMTTAEIRIETVEPDHQPTP